jgi:hypothetical protein
MAIGIGIGLPFGKKETPNPVAQAPVNTSAPVITPESSQVIGTLFTSGNGSWFATRPLTFEYRWTRNGTPISGATSKTYTSVTADEGQTLRCEVRATNAFGVSSYIPSSNSSIGVSLPANTIAPVISGSTTFGSVLTTTNGTWTGTSPITFSYQWKRGGVPIGGATASTYTLVEADSLANITCDVTGTNVAGSTTAGSNTITASDFNPINTVAPALSPSGAQSTGAVITLSNGTWTGATPITFEYRWTRDNIVISGQTSSTYTIVAGDDGTVIKGEVRATNALSTSAYVTTSNQVDASNIDALAQAHFNRVIADGGIVPAGIDGINSYVKALKSVKGGSLSTMLSGYEPHYLGLKTATGVGATAGGRAAAKVYNLVGAIGDQEQTNAANQPLALVHSGTNYSYLSGVNDNFFSTPNSNNNRLTTSINITAHISTLSNSTSGSARTIISKGQTGNQIDYMLLHRDRNLEFVYRDNVANALVTVVATNALPIGTYTGWVNFSRDSATGEFTFRLSSDPANTAIDLINWTVFSSGTSVPGRNLQLSTNSVRVGAEVTGSITRGFSGLINRAIVSDTLNSTILVDFNPANYNRATSQTTWTSTTGETWTINTANTNNALKAAIVDRTIIMGNGTTYGMQAASLSINQAAITQYNVIRKFVNTAGGQLITELGDASVQNNAIAFAINDTAGVNSVNNSTPFTFVAYYTGNSTSLLLHTVVYDGQAASPKSKYLENNILKSVNSTFGTFGNSNINQTGYNLLARNNAAGAWANVIFCGDLVFSGEDNATVQTAMYNAIKTFTNGI